MDTLQLKLFISLSKTMNFTKTANEFYVSQPTVSNYIKSLETDIGVTLLKRDSHSVSLTPEGHEFVTYAKQMLFLQKEAENRLRTMSEGRSGFLSIAMLSSASDLFSQCLKEFVKKYPGVQVNVDLIEGAEMISAMSQHSHDLYFAHQHMIPSVQNISFRVTAETQMYLYAPKEIADRIDVNDFSTLAGYNFVSAPDTGFTLSTQIRRICLNRGINPNIINYYNRADTILLAVNSGVGLAILPPPTGYRNYPNVYAVPIPGSDATICSIIAWPKNSHNPDVQNFLDLDALKG